MSEILADARISDIFLYYGFDNGYVLNRFYGHTVLYWNHHPVKPSIVFFTFHSLTSEAGCEAFRMVFFTFHFSLPKWDL